jgi:hypothetical protein
LEKVKGIIVNTLFKKVDRCVSFGYRLSKCVVFNFASFIGTDSSIADTNKWLAELTNNILAKRII